MVIQDGTLYAAFLNFQYHYHELYLKSTTAMKLLGITLTGSTQEPDKQNIRILSSLIREILKPCLPTDADGFGPVE